MYSTWGLLSCKLPCNCNRRAVLPGVALPSKRPDRYPLHSEQGGTGVSARELAYSCRLRFLRYKHSDPYECPLLILAVARGLTASEEATHSLHNRHQTRLVGTVAVCLAAAAMTKD